MIKEQKELVLLNPQAEFYEFICKNLSYKQRPVRELINKDQSMYFIQSFVDVNKMVDEIELYYEDIMLYEARRWLGRFFQFNKKLSFYEFARCFELEFYQNIYHVCSKSTASSDLC